MRGGLWPYVLSGMVAASAGYWLGSPPGSASSGARKVTWETAVHSASDPAKLTRSVEEIGRIERWKPEPFFYREAEYLAEMLATKDDGERISGIGESYSILPGLFDAWARREPEEALAVAVSLDGHSRYWAIAAVFDAIFELDHEQGLTLYEGLDPGLQSIGLELGHIFHFFADADPARAVEWIFERMDVHGVPIEVRWEEMEACGVFSGLDWRLMERWYRRAEDSGWEPKRSHQWVAGRRSVPCGVARDDPGLALAWMRENAAWVFIDWRARDLESPFWGAGRAFAEAVLTHGMDVAENVYAQLEPGEFRIEFASGLAVRKGAFDPEAASSWMRGLEGEWERYLVGRKLFESWAERDSLAALDHLQSIGDEGEIWREVVLGQLEERAAEKALRGY